MTSLEGCTKRSVSDSACDLSQRRRTGGEALGMSMLNGCLEGSTSPSVKIQHSTVFQTAALFSVAQDCVLGYDRFA